MATEKKLDYFMASSTNEGFVSLFDQLTDERNAFNLFILKGGPGSGKSTLMKKAAEALGGEIEYIHCASDPCSLDAIIDHTHRAAIIDGTAPHMIDPKLAGIKQRLINVGDAWDERLLVRNKEQISLLSAQIADEHKTASAYISAFAKLLKSNRTIMEKWVDKRGMIRFAENIMAGIEGDFSTIEQERLLSAVTVGDTVFFQDTLASLCKDIYVITDEWGAASSLLLQKIRDNAIDHGMEVITCRCSVFPKEKIDHLIFPRLGIAFATSNRFHPLRLANAKPIPSFMMESPYTDTAQRLASHAQELMYEAQRHKAKAKSLHDILEQYYVDAMDFIENDKICDEMINDILQ